MLAIIPRESIEVARIRSFPNLYLNDVETALLVTLVASVKPKVILEIGCNQGRTAKIILDNIPTLERYIGIDVLPGHVPTLACQRTEVPRSAGIYAAADERFWLLVKERGSLDIGPQDLEPCDAVFVDGDHSDRAVTHDLHVARALTRPGGIIIVHDYGNEAVEVTRAIDRTCDEQGWPWQWIEGTWLAFLRISGVN